MQQTLSLSYSSSTAWSKFEHSSRVVDLPSLRNCHLNRDMMLSEYEQGLLQPIHYKLHMQQTLSLPYSDSNARSKFKHSNRVMESPSLRNCHLNRDKMWGEYEQTSLQLIHYKPHVQQTSTLPLVGLLCC